MITIKGVYKNGKILLENGVDLPKSSQVIVTADSDVSKIFHLASSAPSPKKMETDFEKLRKFERIKADGKITILHQEDRHSFSLFDYSKGGLSFLSDRDFEIGSVIRAGIMDPQDQQNALMELDLLVRGVYDHKEKKKVGCQFADSLDEELWHGLLRFV